MASYALDTPESRYTLPAGKEILWVRMIFAGMIVYWLMALLQLLEVRTLLARISVAWLHISSKWLVCVAAHAVFSASTCISCSLFVLWLPMLRV